jgi:hypothetical protein
MVLAQDFMPSKGLQSTMILIGKVFIKRTNPADFLVSRAQPTALTIVAIDTANVTFCSSL